MTPERNKLCPCGSGKKYKACCLLKVRRAEENLREARETERYSQNKIRVGNALLALTMMHIIGGM